MPTLGDLLLTSMKDGDTADTSDGTAVRINNIDTNETPKWNKPGQVGAEEAWIAAENYAQQDGARIQTDGSKDRYGRTLGDVVVDGQEPLSEKLVREGHAIPKYTNDKRTDDAQTIGNLLLEDNDNAVASQNLADAYAETSINHDLSNPDHYYSPDNTFEKGIRRGLDNTQLGIAYLLDDKAAVEKNLEELRRNEAEVGSIKNIGSVSDAFTWSLEVLGSQIPQLAVDAGFAVAGAASAGAGASGIVARRVGMQAAKKALMNKATKEVAAQAARDAAFAHFKKMAATGAKVGGAAGIYGQSTGESMSQFRGDGADYLPALASSLGISVPQAALEYAGLGRALSDVARATGLSKRMVDSTITARFGEMVKTMGVEGGTEAMQTALDLGANLALNGTEFNWDELLDAAAAGALVGGVFSGAGQIIGGGYESAKARINRDLDLVTDNITRPNQPTTAEPLGDLEAQVNDMLNPETSRDSVFISDANELSDLRVPDGVSMGRVEGGVMLTNKPEIAEQLYTDPAAAKKQFDSRYVTPKTEMTNRDFEHSTVVQRQNEQGDVVDEQLTTAQTVEEVRSVLEQDIQPGEQIVETNADQAQAVRTEKVDGQRDTRHEAPRPESGVDGGVRPLRRDDRVGTDVDSGRREDLRAVQAQNDSLASVPRYKTIGDYFDSQGQGFDPTAVDPEISPDANETQAKQENLSESSDEDLSNPIQQAFAVVSRVIPQTGVFGPEVAKREETLRDAFPMLEFERVQIETDRGKQRYTFKPVFKRFGTIQQAKQYVAENLSDFDDHYYQFKNGELVPLKHAPEIRPEAASSTTVAEMYNKAKQQATLDKTGERSWQFGDTRLHLPTLTEYGRKELADPSATDLAAFDQAVGSLALEGHFPAAGLITHKGVKKGQIISTRKEAVNVGQLVAQKEAAAKKGRGGDELIDPEDFTQEPITEQEKVDAVKEKDAYKNDGKGRFAEDNVLERVGKEQVQKRAQRVEKKSLESERKRFDGSNTNKAQEARARIDKRVNQLERDIAYVASNKLAPNVLEQHQTFVDFANSLLGDASVDVAYSDLEGSFGRVHYNVFGKNRHQIVLDEKLKDKNAGYFVLAHELAHVYIAKLVTDPTYAERLQSAFESQNKATQTKYNDRAGDALTEWLSDQLALKLMSKAKWDQGRHSGVLNDVLYKVKAFFQKLRAALAKAGIFADKNVQRQLEELLKTNYWKDISTFWAETTQPPDDFDLAEPIQKFREENPGVKRKVNAVNARLKNAYKSESGRGVQKIFNYSDNILRQIDPALADMFHKKIGTSGEQGYLVLKEVMTEYQAEVTALRDSMGDDAFQKAAKELESSDPGDTLSAPANRIKKWLNNFYTSYAKQAMPTLGKLDDNFFPRVYDAEEVIYRTGEFVELVAKHLKIDWKKSGKPMPSDPTHFIRVAEEVAKKLTDAHGVFEMDFEVPELAQGPRNVSNLGRVLELGPDFNADLAKHKFVYEDHHETLMYYIAQTVKRGEAEKKFGGYFEAKGPVINGEMLMGPTMTHLIQATPKLRELFEKHFNHEFSEYLMQVFNPTDAEVEKFLIGTGYARRDEVFEVYRPTGHLTDAVTRIRERDPVAARDAEQVISGYFGRLGADMNPSIRKAQSWAIVAQSYLTLAFSAVASLPDFAGIVMRGRNAPGMAAAMKGMMQVLGDYKNKKEAARLLGMLNERAAINGILSRYGADHMSPGATKAMDFLFKYNGQEALTNFSRVMAVSAAETVLVDMAQRGDTERLSHLNLTPEEVKQWQTGKLDGRKLVKIKNALRQYTDESILRPNAAMRPIWASDPRYALLWHLKSFVYAFGKVIMGGAIQEMRNSGKNGDYFNAMLQPVMMGVTFMPLAALGLFLRGIVQYDMWEGEDENLDPYEEMAMGNYLFELTKRSGFWGPFEMAYKFAQTNDTQEAFLDLTGPTMDHLHVLLSAQNTVGDKVSRSIPVFSQLYGLQDALGVK